MPNSLKDRILSRLSQGPLPAAKLYAEFELEGFNKNQCSTAVNRLLTTGTISRAVLRLGAGSFVLYKDKLAISAENLRALVGADFYGRPALSRLVSCLCVSHGTVTRVDVAKIACISVGPTDKPDWREVDQLIDGLLELGILKRVGVGASMDTWAAPTGLLRKAGFAIRTPGFNADAASFREKVRLRIVDAIGEHLFKNSFIAQGYKIADDAVPWVSSAGVPFDVFGFCYVAGIQRYAGKVKKPRPFIGDILHSQCPLSYAVSFIERVRRSGVKGETPVAFLLAKGFDKEAFEALRAAGILIWKNSQFLGGQTAKAIERVLELMEKIVRQQNVDPAAFAQAFEGLENFGSIFGNLKGKLFEILIGYYYEQSGFKCQLGWKISNEAIPFDVDVFATRTSEAVFVECKGLRSSKTVPHEDVKRHFQQRTPAARAVALTSTTARYSRFKSVLITTGLLDQDSIDYVDEANKNSNKVTFELWSREHLLDQFAHNGLSELIEVVRKYF